jgi:clan AA aspartic protease (TIGR02281 family)
MHGQAVARSIAYVGVAFLAGLLAGVGLVLWYQQPPARTALESIPSVGPSAGLPSGPATAPSTVASGYESNSAQVRAVQVLELLREGRIDAGLDDLERFEKLVDQSAHEALRADVLAEARRWLDEGRLEDALRLSRAYRDRYLHDAGVLGVLADIYWQLGRAEDALLSLFEILDYPPSEAVAEITRDRILTLQRTHAAGLSQRREFRSLVAFYGLLLDLDPNNDDYRLARAEWLAQVGEFGRAADLLGEVGAARSDEVADLSARIGLLQAGIPVERQGDRLIAEVVIANQSVRMLVDTGATMTSLSLTTLRRLGARRTGRSAKVVTAAGVITAPVFLLDELVVGEQTFSNHPVLGLELGDAGVAGLLGMDVLATTGLPRL